MAKDKLAKVTPKNTKKTDLVSIAGKSPELVLERAAMIAGPLSKFIDEKKLYADISGKKHVMAEGWSTMGVMLGVFPRVEWTRKMDTDPSEAAWESRVILSNTAGEVLGAGEAMASNKERNARGNMPVWATNEYSIRSMAQTRALGKAFRLSFSWLMTTAGYEATPMEEMPHDEAPVTPPPADTQDKKPNKPKISIVQIRVIEGLIAKTKYGTLEEFEKALGKQIGSLSSEGANKVIQRLGEAIKEKEGNDDQSETVENENTEAENEEGNEASVQEG